MLDARDHVAQWLWHERHLLLKNPRREPRSTAHAVTYLGRRVTRGSITPTRQAFARMRVRIGAALRDPDWRRVARSLAAYRGVLGLHHGGEGDDLFDFEDVTDTFVDDVDTG